MFCEIKDKISNSSNYENLGKPCDFCQLHYHKTIDCDYVHLKRDAYRAIKRFTLFDTK